MLLLRTGVISISSNKGLKLNLSRRRKERLYRPIILPVLKTVTRNYKPPSGNQIRRRNINRYDYLKEMIYIWREKGLLYKFHLFRVQRKSSKQMSRFVYIINGNSTWHFTPSIPFKSKKIIFSYRILLTLLSEPWC